ncbi:MAG TPA: phage portal protein, partial [Lachnospiraceae bacterium]|nr:phage portal protein [Lachnospiraceae bacterium]
MADNYVRLADTISSKEGKAYITINGQNREL